MTGWDDVVLATRTGMNVAAGLTGEWTGNLRIRRVGTTVELRGTLNGSSISTYEFYSLPEGFGTGFATGKAPYWAVWNGTEFKFGQDNGNQLKIVENTSSATAYPTFVWTTTDGWPTSLPGVAV